VLPANHQLVALDCDVHSVPSAGAGGGVSRVVVTRVCVVNATGQVLLDRYISPHSAAAPPSAAEPHSASASATHSDVLSVQRELATDFLRHKVVVGHHLQPQLQALGLALPKAALRDTALYKGLGAASSTASAALNGPLSLARLVSERLGIELPHTNSRTGVVGASAIDRARAALALYKATRKQWVRACAVVVVVVVVSV
jgi:hypothetical protein